MTKDKIASIMLVGCCAFTLSAGAVDLGTFQSETVEFEDGLDANLDSEEQEYPTYLEEENVDLSWFYEAQVEEYRKGGSGGAPVWGPFIRNLNGCAPGCQPVDYHAYRQQRNSCHNSGRAIDVFGVRCGGKTHYAINGGRFAEIVRCMKGRMRVLYRNGKGRTSGHHDHAHFSIGCSVPGRPNYW